MKKILIIIVAIFTLSYLASICSTAIYSGIQIKVSRNIVASIGATNIISLIISLYTIAIAKEIINNKLWLNYKRGFKTALITTILLIVSPIFSISLIYNDSYNRI